MCTNTLFWSTRGKQIELTKISSVRVPFQANISHLFFFLYACCLINVQIKNANDHITRHCFVCWGTSQEMSLDFFWVCSYFFHGESQSPPTTRSPCGDLLLSSPGQTRMHPHTQTQCHNVEKHRKTFRMHPLTSFNLDPYSNLVDYKMRRWWNLLSIATLKSHEVSWMIPKKWKLD